MTGDTRHIQHVELTFKYSEELSEDEIPSQEDQTPSSPPTPTPGSGSGASSACSTS